MAPRMRRSLERAVRNIAQWGDTDVFPLPLENHVFHDRTDQIVDLLLDVHDNFEREFLALRGPNRLCAVGCLLLLTTVGAPIGAGEESPALEPSVSPEPLGWSTAGLETLREAAGSNLTHSYLLIDRSGQIIDQYGAIDAKLQVFSIRKSFVSGLFGIFAAEGRVDLEVTLADLGIDDVEGLTDDERQARVLDLLASHSGVYHPAAYETPGMGTNRPERGSHPPGEHFFYNNWDFNALNTILEQAIGMTVAEAFEERIARPIGMQSFSTADVQRIEEPVSRHPAIEFWLTAPDLARFGLLFLNEGRWGDTRVIPAGWVAESTAVHSDLGMFGGYGLSWWVALWGEHFPFVKLPDGTFSARGTGEQLLLVLPHLDAVFVHRTEVTSPDQEMMHVVDTGLTCSPV